MFLELEVKNDLLELEERKLLVVSGVLLDDLFFSGELLAITKCFIIRSCLLVLNHLNELLLKDLIVIRVIHLLNDASPLPLLKDTVLNLLHESVDLCFRLEGVSLLEQGLEKSNESVLHMHLDVSELLVTLVLQDLSK